MDDLVKQCLIFAIEINYIVLLLSCEWCWDDGGDNFCLF